MSQLALGPSDTVRNKRPISLFDSAILAPASQYAEPFARHLADGHHRRYLADAEYITTHADQLAD